MAQLKVPALHELYDLDHITVLFKGGACDSGATTPSSPRGVLSKQELVLEYIHGGGVMSRHRMEDQTQDSSHCWVSPGPFAY